MFGFVKNVRNSNIVSHEAKLQNHQNFSINEFEYLYNYIPDAYCESMHINNMVKQYVHDNNIDQLLDLGCGDGNMRGFLKEEKPHLEYTGIDVFECERMPAEDFKTFDGVNIPLSDQSFDCIFSKQVLEHVEHLSLLIKDVYRVLKPGGVFLGSCAGLEPLNGHSLFNLTPIGLNVILKQANLTLLRLYPGTMVDTLMEWHLKTRVLGNQNSDFGESRFFKQIDSARDILNNEKEVNYYKLIFSGHINFIAQKQST